VQLAGAGNGFGPPVDLQFLKNPAVVPFDRIQGKVQLFANFIIG
jgi:hypothetical protein